MSELLKAMQEMMERHIGSLASRMEAGQEERKAEMKAKREKVDAWLADMTGCRKERMTSQETTEARLECKEPTSEETESAAERRELPKEHAAVKPVGGLRKRHRGRHLAAGRRGQSEERTRGNCVSRKKLAAACRGTTCHAGVARRRGNVRKNQTRDKVAGGTQKGRTAEGGNGRARKVALEYGTETSRRSYILEARGHPTRSTGDCRVGDRKANCWIFCQISKNQRLDIVEGSAPSETEEEPTDLKYTDLGSN
jgi:hypothetical protein